MKIEVWMEGFAIQGNTAIAAKIWEGEADNFDDAVNKYNKKCKEKYGQLSAVKQGLIDGKTMVNMGLSII
jgi:hypothetical protein